MQEEHRRGVGTELLLCETESPRTTSRGWAMLPIAGGWAMPAPLAYRLSSLFLASPETCYDQLVVAEYFKPAGIECWIRPASLGIPQGFVKG